MTDRELLELAAKAAGIELTWKDWGAGNGATAYKGDGSYMPCRWNPLSDDGGALRLAVKLGIGMVHHLGWGQVFHPSFNGERIDFHYDPDAETATRRAIVRAAAEIGKRGA